MERCINSCLLPLPGFTLTPQWADSLAVTNAVPSAITTMAENLLRACLFSWIGASAFPCKENIIRMHRNIVFVHVICDMCECSAEGVTYLPLCHRNASMLVLERSRILISILEIYYNSCSHCTVFFLEKKLCYQLLFSILSIL